MSISIHRIKANEIELLEGLMTVFADVFSDPQTYTQNQPSANYVHSLLASDTFIALVAIDNHEVIGGLTAYELKKFEQERSEIYIYDLAVITTQRRKGIASLLIEELKVIAKTRGAYLIFVQADTGIEDEPAIALYTKLGKREDVLHFDITVKG